MVKMAAPIRSGVLLLFNANFKKKVHLLSSEVKWSCVRSSDANVFIKTTSTTTGKMLYYIFAFINQQF